MPVILISGTHNLLEVMHRDGAPDDFITKPFDLDVLQGAIEEQLAY